MRALVYPCIATLLVAGCRLTSGEAVTAKRSPLQPAQSSPDSVTMEIIWARFPVGDRGLNDEAWREIDETQLEPAVRLELANNGFRAGVIGGRLPDAIARALNQHGEAPEDITTDGVETTMEIIADPVVHGRISRLRRNRRSEVLASDVYPSLPVLVSNVSELSGRTYQHAQAVYALRVDPQPDRTTLVELVPELHHGPARLRWTAEDGIGMRQAPLRDREVFDRLRLSARLAPGQMLVLMSLPDARSRLGHYFHTVESADGPQQKLILIRLAEVPPGDTFAGTARH